jgi:ascorbate-specific PTS system EIIC-type component UlaA
LIYSAETKAEILLSRLWALAHTHEDELVREVCREAAIAIQHNQSAPIVDWIGGVPNQRRQA